jgi:hypothetical protein
MQYALLIYMNEETFASFAELPEEQRQAITDEYMAIRALPETVDGAQLQRTDTATTVRANGSGVLTTDGPFAETKEAFGGYYVVDAPDLDRALEIAAQIPAVRMGGSVEVRPLVYRA